MRRDCALDASLILSIASANAFQLLWSHAAYAWHLSGVVRGELRRRASRDPIDAAIAAGHLQLIELDTGDNAQLAEWAQWLERVDPGEAEAIAIASTRNWLVGIEDRGAQRAIDRYLGRDRWVNSASLLIDAVKGGALALAEADAIFRKLDCYQGYAKRGFPGIRELMAAVQ